MQKKHPLGLPVLFFTEMWERFGFYLMIGIFFLYMTDTATGGLGLSNAAAANIYGTYMALIYLTPFLGGLLADRILGYRKSIIIGGALMGFGYLGLSLPGTKTLWISLFVIIVGNGLFKPNISTLVGNLYAEERYRPNKDAGFNIFYMGINIGAFICNFVAAYLRNHFGWGYAFAAAGIGMFIGLFWFLGGQKHVKNADIMKPASPGDMPLAKVIMVVFVPALIFGALGWMIHGKFFGSDANDAFMFATIPILTYLASLWWRASREEKAPIGALLLIFAVATFFWAIYFQNGTALTLWAENYTNRRLPRAILPIAARIGAVQELDTSPREVPRLDERGHIMTDADGRVVKELGTALYFRNLPKDQWPAEGEKLNLLSTEIFQSINPFWVVLLTPVIIGIFGALQKRGHEPSTPGKIGLGLIIIAFTSLIMVGAVYAAHNGSQKCSPWWLVATYLSTTAGELCLSPMGLSLVSKLSPQRFTALMMGGWFLTLSIGNKLSGVLAGLWDLYPNKQCYFLVNFSGAALAAVAIFFMLPWLNRVMKDYAGEGQSPAVE
jgi:proton-dependent oligopeptide transporter, POT family